MSTGRIQFAEQDGTFVLKFVGEVRLTLCSALDATIDRIFTALNFNAIVIDLTETRSIDSTTLGPAGQTVDPVAAESRTAADRRHHPRRHHAVCCSPWASSRSSTSSTKPVPCPECLDDLPDQDQSEEVVRIKVLEAHKILMGLNDTNREAFHDLVNALERH